MERTERQFDIFDSVFPRAELGMAVLDVRGRILRANEALGRYLGWSPAELAGRDLFDAAPANERHVTRGVLDALVHRPSVHTDQRFMRSDGRTICVLATYSMVDTNGVYDAETQLIVAIFDDITAERDALKEEREREGSVRRAYADVVSVMTGGRLLILPHAELPDQLGDRVFGPMPFDDEAGPGDVRHAMREFVVDNLGDIHWDDGFEVALGEALLNALKHAGSGEASLFMCNNVLQAMVSDRGPGVDFGAVHPSLADAGYSPAAALGVGFTLILSFTSRILLATGRQGTTIVLEGHDGGPDQTQPE